MKECYYYLDSTPTHSYMKALYKYPQNEYPYSWLVNENQNRSRQEPEFELADTGKMTIRLEVVSNFGDSIEIHVLTSGQKLAPARRRIARGVLKVKCGSPLSHMWRRGGLVVSAFDFRSRGPHCLSSPRAGLFKAGLS